MVLAHRGVIESFARALVCEYPGLDIDDVIGEGWVCALESKQKWSPKGGASFSSYLYRRLHWLKLEIVDKYMKDRKVKGRLALEVEQISTMEPGDRILVAAASKLYPKERRLLGLLVCPPVEFVQRESQGSRIRTKQYAKQLDCSETAVRWYVSRIKHVLNDVL